MRSVASTHASTAFLLRAQAKKEKRDAVGPWEAGRKKKRHEERMAEPFVSDVRVVDHPSSSLVPLVTRASVA